MPTILYTKLSEGWNAEPNAPFEQIEIVHTEVRLRFYLNHMLYKQFQEEDVGIVTFTGCSRWRQGIDNDYAFFHQQPSSRYCRLLPKWREFYELAGEDPLRDQPKDWSRIGSETVASARHFLFYFRDSSFEFIAGDWSFTVDRSGVGLADPDLAKRSTGFDEV